MACYDIFEGVDIIRGRYDVEFAKILTREALSIRRRIAAGVPPGGEEEVCSGRGLGVRASAGPVIADRTVEITGPVERKMVINALNSGAKVSMA